MYTCIMLCNEIIFYYLLLSVITVDRKFGTIVRLTYFLLDYVETRRFLLY